MLKFFWDRRLRLALTIGMLCADEGTDGSCCSFSGQAWQTRRLCHWWVRLCWLCQILSRVRWWWGGWRLLFLKRCWESQSGDWQSEAWTKWLHEFRSHASSTQSSSGIPNTLFFHRPQSVSNTFAWKPPLSTTMSRFGEIFYQDMLTCDVLATIVMECFMLYASHIQQVQCSQSLAVQYYSRSLWLLLRLFSPVFPLSFLFFWA